MKTELKFKADQMLELYKTIEKDFMWEHNLTKHFVALLYTEHDKRYNKETFKNTLDMINKETGIFSNFRSSNRFMLAGLMHMESDSTDGVFHQIRSCESTLKENGFKSGMYLPLASYALYKTSKEQAPSQLAQKAQHIYQQMKKNHPFLTSGDDYSMSVLLAASEVDLGRIEEAYEKLNIKGFYKGNELQRLSHILALSNRSIDELVEICFNMKWQLKEAKLNIPTTYYATLGIIALIYFEDETIVSEWIELTKYLSTLKKFKWLGKGMNVMLASSLVSSQWIDETLKSEATKLTISISIDALIAAQTAAIIAATTAASAGAAASASS
ncbi:MAG: hypothetical protein BGO41_14430 [Clostridiales bacterium 38-18]|nr:MAG: hypothetical protein BGO41_14430 [Clostridiales bacterium 38-18]